MRGEDICSQILSPHCKGAESRALWAQHLRYDDRCPGAGGPGLAKREMRAIRVDRQDVQNVDRSLGRRPPDGFLACDGQPGIAKGTLIERRDRFWRVVRGICAPEKMLAILADDALRAKQYRCVIWWEHHGAMIARKSVAGADNLSPHAADGCVRRKWSTIGICRRWEAQLLSTSSPSATSCSPSRSSSQVRKLG